MISRPRTWCIQRQMQACLLKRVHGCTLTEVPAGVSLCASRWRRRYLPQAFSLTFLIDVVWILWQCELCVLSAAFPKLASLDKPRPNLLLEPSHRSPTHPHSFPHRNILSLPQLTGLRELFGQPVGHHLFGAYQLDPSSQSAVSSRDVYKVRLPITNPGGDLS